jgi:predicted kinase
LNEPEADGRRDILEGGIISLAMSALRFGINVILDFGVWSKEERMALRFLAQEQGAEYQLAYAPVERSEQLRRLAARLETDPHRTFVRGGVVCAFVGGFGC